MSASGYTILAYAIGIVLLWGYAAVMRFGFGVGAGPVEVGEEDRRRP